MVSLVLVAIALVIFRITASASITFKNRYLPGYVFDRSYPMDWLACSLKCQHLKNCVSYNFHLVSGSCELNDHGILKEYNPEEQLTEAKDYVFHQLRPVSKNLHPPKRKAHNQCDCNCPSQSACTPTQEKQTIVSALPSSCNDLWHKKRSTSGAYDIRSHNGEGKVRLFCQMNETLGCGSGGWTLVMKIDGSKTTFRYASPMWENKTPFQPENGYNLDQKEVKLSSYWSTPMVKLCLGMTYNDTTHWIVTNYTASSLHNVIEDGANRRANVDPGTWKSLIETSSIETDCTWEGFNAKAILLSGAAQARIGIVGSKIMNTCGSPVSRIGFGTSGSIYGMNDKNSCGNEDESEKSIMAFGYILVQ